MLTVSAFIFLTLSFLSLWVRREPKIWGTLLAASLLCGLVSGNVLWPGIIFIAGLLLLWAFYAQRPTIPLFLVLIAAGLCFKSKLLPGFHPIAMTEKFRIGLEGPMIGLFPLALLVPLSQTKSDWSQALKGLLLGCGVIALLALLATAVGATHWQLKIPSAFASRAWSNLFLTSIPEEGFYRGFVQRELTLYFQNTMKGKLWALFLTSILFTLMHIFWSPNIAILAFVFLASLLYGAIYLIFGKIESAIGAHFLLNLIHMTFFEYHAM